MHISVAGTDYGQLQQARFSGQTIISGPSAGLSLGMRHSPTLAA